MTIERTLSIIKPDATRRNLTGAINDRFEKRGLRIVAQKRVQLSQAQAERFYKVHAERPFYRGLVAFMSSGPVVVQVLEGRDASIGEELRRRGILGASASRLIDVDDAIGVGIGERPERDGVERAEYRRGGADA